MNGLDLVVIAVIVLSGLFAFARGFVKEALSVAAWIGAALAALYALPFAAPIAARFLPKGAVSEAAAAIAVFVVALIVLSLITSAISRRVKASSLSAVDRTLGLIFGLARGVVLVCLAYIALAWALPGKDQPRWIAEARTLPFLESGAERLRALVPAAYREKAAARVEDTRRAAEQVREAAGAMGALSAPRLPTDSGRGHGPVYSPDNRRDLDRLIQQQQD